MENKSEAENTTNIKKLGELIRNIKVAMLNTVDEEGRIHGRPMATQQIDSHGDIWFLTAASSHKIHELNKTHQVQLNYVSTNENSYVSATGTAEVFRDSKKVEELWSPLYRAWFPNGTKDPDLVCIKVHVEQAEYWDLSSRTMIQLKGFIKAMVTGTPYESNQQEHGKINLAG